MNQISPYQPLFDLMANEHNLTLLESQLDDIIRASQKVIALHTTATKESIINAVCKAYGTKFEAINIKSRKRKYLEPRQMIMFMLCTFTNMHLKDIGKLFKVKYDHSTVIHHREAVSATITVDDNMFEKYSQACKIANIYKEIKRR
jgi:chromosomal replication initiation ATPase DnaA